jgi:hypothetical protein
VLDGEGVAAVDTVAEAAASSTAMMWMARWRGCGRCRFRPLGRLYRGNPGRALAALILSEFDGRQDC